jgi:hypothetical protein
VYDLPRVRKPCIEKPALLAVLLAIAASPARAQPAVDEARQSDNEQPGAPEEDDARMAAEESTPQPEYVQPAPEEVGQKVPEEPTEAPPPLPDKIEAPPVPEGAPPAPTPATLGANPEGKWVFTTDYGWLWAPYGEAFTYYPAEGYPYTYVYEPSFGWTWLVAPWVYGAYWPWAHRPYTGPFRGRFGWYHGHWGWYHPWGWYHGYRAYYGEGWHAGVAAYRRRFGGARGWRGVGGYYRGGVYRYRPHVRRPVRHPFRRRVHRRFHRGGHRR